MGHENAAAAEKDAYLVQATLRALSSGCDVVLACRGIEREVVCLEGVAKAISENTSFEQLCFEKAERVFLAAQRFC